MSERRSRPGNARTALTTPPSVSNNCNAGVEFRYAVESRSVAWWPVHEYVEKVLERVEGGWPMAGTPAWCALADDDPRKLFALIAASEHHVLRMETAQEARAEASKAIAGAADWRAVAQELRQRAEARRRGVRIERWRADA